MRYLLILFICAYSVIVSQQYDLTEYDFIGKHQYIHTNDNLIVIPTWTNGPEPFFRDIIYFSYDYGETFDTLLTWEKDLFNEFEKEDAISVEHTLIGDNLFSVKSNGNLIKINLNNKTIDTVDIPIKHKAYGFEKWDKTVLIDSYKESIALITDSTKLMLSQDLGASWKVIDLPDFRNMNTNLKVSGLDYVNDSTIILGLSNATASLIKSFYATQDLCETWEYHEHSPTSAFWQKFYDEDLGFAYGAANRRQDHPEFDHVPVICKVTDLGKNFQEVWRDSPDAIGLLRAAHPVSKNEWWFVSHFKILHTTDGGNTINKIIVNNYEDNLTDWTFWDISVDGRGNVWVATERFEIVRFNTITSVELKEEKQSVFRSEYYDLNGNKLDENRLPSNTAFIKVNYDKNNKIIGTDKRIIIGDW